MNVRESFAELVRSPDGRLDVGALLIAAEEYPELDIAHYVGMLDLMAEELRDTVAAQTDPLSQIEVLNTYLFSDKGFHGNREQYNDPRNSFLNDVLDRRTGLPITLSVVYTELARRLGLPIVGVGFPGHFLAKYDVEPEAIIIDVFGGGVILDADDCHQLLVRFHGPDAAFELSMLDAWPARRILLRILSNLRTNYLHREELHKAIAAIERMLLIDAGDAHLQHQLREVRGRLAQFN